MEYKYIPYPEFKPGLYRKERFGVPYITREVSSSTINWTTLETTVQFKYYDFYIDEVLEPYFQEAKEKIKFLIEENIVNKESNFSNGRFVRNIYEDIILRQAQRVIKILSPTKAELQEIKEQDIMS